ncbi:calphotin-like [Tribolium madens]|uniref:calphotin-like n=1 Tax=Tribolium madens TaxID=41895 RepID=UPI001CF74F75|nr:calphotin-like [Tribolium madens]
MKFMLSLLALGYVAIAVAAPSLPVNPGGIGGLFKGPNSETIIKGPDGSVITSAAEGGEVHTNLEPIVVAEEVVPVEPVVPIEAVAVPSPPVENKQSSDLIGPSGRIVTQGSQSIIAGPASTTITGSAVLAETVIKGAPVVGTPVLSVAPAVVPVATVTAAPIAVSPVSVTVPPSPLVLETDLVAPARISSVTPTSLNVIATASVLPHYTATATVETVSSLPVISSTAAPVPVAGYGVHGVTVNGFKDHLVHEFSTASPLPVIHSTASPVNGVVGVDSSTESPIISSTVSPVIQKGIAVKGLVGNTDHINLGPQLVYSPTPSVPNRIHQQDLAAHGLVGTNDRIDLGPQLIHDQLAIDNRQLHLNPALIPPANIIPPEISVTPKTPIARLRPTPGTLLTTPGLGTVANSPNILREEGSVGINVTPNSLQYVPQYPHILREDGTGGYGVSPNTLRYVPQHPHILKEEGSVSFGVTPNVLRQDGSAGYGVTSNTIQYVPQSPHLLREDGSAGLGVTPNTLQYVPQYPHILREDGTGGYSVTPNTLRYVPQPPQILKEDGSASLGVTPNVLKQDGSVGYGVTPNTLQYVPQSSHILREDGSAGLGLTPNTLQYIPQPQLTNQRQPQLSSQQFVALQNQQNLLNNQIQYAPAGQATGPALFTPTEEPNEDRPGEDPNVAIGGARITPPPPPPNIPQQGVLSSELAKSGIDASQLQLTNVPLSAVSNFPEDLNVKRAVIYNVRPQSRGRHGRQVENEKKTN